MSERNDPSSMHRRLLLAGLAGLGVPGLVAGCSPVAAAGLPEAKLPPLPGLRNTAGWDVPGLETARLRGGVTVLNIWASWCPYCRGEHDLLKGLSADGRFRLIGLVHRDSLEAARNYLLSAGNPYAAVSIDEQNRIGRALGQRGVPNTYVIGRDLKVVQKIGGALSEHSIRSQVIPAVEKARAAPVVGS